MVPARDYLPSTDQVDLWLWRTDNPQRAKEAWELLSTEEQDRARRLRQQKHQIRFLCARMGLRHVLAWYLGCTPQEVCFRVGTNGKPRLAGEKGTAIQFNLAHSGELAVLAVRERFEVGVDLEKVRRIFHLLPLGERFFSATEAAALRSQSENRREELFFRLWTCKEAVLKGVGTGLTFPLDQVPICWLEQAAIPPASQCFVEESLGKNTEQGIAVIRAAELRRVDIPRESFRTQREEEGWSSTWWVWEWQPAPEYFAAVASSTPWHVIRFRLWQEQPESWRVDV